MRKTNEGNKINIYKRFGLLILGMILVCLGTSLMMKANLGQTSMAGLSKNVEFLTGMKSGTVLALFNVVCFIVQVILLREEFKLVQILQLVATSIFGMGVNFFSYDFSITATMNPNIYIIKWVCLVSSMLISTLGVASMIKADLIFLPYEGFCNAIVYKSKKPFSKVRPIIDGSIVCLSIICMLIFSIPNTTVREGTIFCTIFFGKFVGWYNKNLFKQ